MVERAVVLDARDEEQYEERHVGKALNVPVGIDMTSARNAVRNMSSAKVLPVDKSQVSEEWPTEADIIVTLRAPWERTLRVLWERTWAPSASYSFALLTLFAGLLEGSTVVMKSWLLWVARSFPFHLAHSIHSHIRSLSHRMQSFAR